MSLKLFVRMGVCLFMYLIVQLTVTICVMYVSVTYINVNRVNFVKEAAQFEQKRHLVTGNTR